MFQNDFNGNDNSRFEAVANFAAIMVQMTGFSATSVSVEGAGRVVVNFDDPSDAEMFFENVVCGRNAQFFAHSEMNGCDVSFVVASDPFFGDVRSEFRRG